MNDLKKEFIFQKVNKLKGVGLQLSIYLKNKNHVQHYNDITT